MDMTSTPNATRQFYAGTRAPEVDGVYQLKGGQFARYWLGQWRVPSNNQEKAKEEDRLDAFSSPQFRTQEHHRWAVLAVPEAQNFDPPAGWQPMYSRWRHGGWYVSNVRYPNGGSGCVSRNYPDGKWRIVCDDRRTELGATGDFTYPHRDAAARAEYALAKSQHATA